MGADDAGVEPKKPDSLAGGGNVIRSPILEAVVTCPGTSAPSLFTLLLL